MSVKFRMASNGNATCFELDGKSIGTGVLSVDFTQNGYGEDGRLALLIDLENFAFMPDGYFEKFEKKLVGKVPPNDCLIERRE